MQKTTRGQASVNNEPLEHLFFFFFFFSSTSSSSSLSSYAIVHVQTKKRLVNVRHVLPGGFTLQNLINRSEKNNGKIKQTLAQQPDRLRNAALANSIRPLRTTCRCALSSLSRCRYLFISIRYRKQCNVTHPIPIPAFFSRAIRR